MEQVNNYYEKIVKKYNKSKTIFYIINFLILFLSAIFIILNLFAIRYNPGGNDTKWLFVTIAILTAISAFISSITSLYIFKTKQKEYFQKINALEEEKRKYLNEEDIYSNSTNKDKILIDKATNILSDE